MSGHHGTSQKKSLVFPEDGKVLNLSWNVKLLVGNQIFLGRKVTVQFLVDISVTV